MGGARRGCPCRACVNQAVSPLDSRNCHPNLGLSHPYNDGPAPARPWPRPSPRGGGGGQGLVPVWSVCPHHRHWYPEPRNPCPIVAAGPSARALSPACALLDGCGGQSGCWRGGRGQSSDLGPRPRTHRCGALEELNGRGEVERKGPPCSRRLRPPSGAPLWPHSPQVFLNAGK